MESIKLPDIDGPTVQLCWKQEVKDGIVQTFERCDRRKGHGGLHTWEQPKQPRQHLEALERWAANDSNIPESVRTQLQAFRRAAEEYMREALVEPPPQEQKICGMCARGLMPFYLESGAGRLWHRNEANQLFLCERDILAAPPSPPTQEPT